MSDPRLQLTLQRIEQNAFATFGQLRDGENRSLGVTLELPWHDNRPNESCIPAAAFPFHRILSPKREYDVFVTDDVPGRTRIEIHIGNLPQDTEGCILIGSNYGTVNGQHGIRGSRAAFARFMATMQGIGTFTLDVRDPALAAR